MYLGLAALEWDTKVTGLALRLDGLYARRDWASQLTPLPDDPPMFANRFAFRGSRVSAAGALVGLTYDFGLRSAFRPYVLGSTGLVRLNDRVTSGVSFMCTGTCVMLASAPAMNVQQNRPLTGAAQVGAGFVYAFPWVSLVADARYMTVNYSPTRGLNGAVPVSLGLRFGRRGGTP